ncbi:MAG: hypothetical protein QJT81_00420 [Candidatus Thiothrix putei]|uniref:Uncharacterized protein n=1 Tax=Candidatus Thiothrix putei TaxID=3080811 RepID=A0AA95KJI8_9GAMM|nr:MAG: hypothetical protein QJT81_00420 [Candidatus Thiothrix putei]
MPFFFMRQRRSYLAPLAVHQQATDPEQQKTKSDANGNKYPMGWLVTAFLHHKVNHAHPCKQERRKPTHSSEVPSNIWVSHGYQLGRIIVSIWFSEAGQILAQTIPGNNAIIFYSVAIHAN